MVQYGCNLSSNFDFLCHPSAMRFDFSISDVAGKDLNIADTLSRAPVENMSQSDTDFENETKAFVDVDHVQ
jgi:hypothetical protein